MKLPTITKGVFWGLLGITVLWIATRAPIYPQMNPITNWEVNQSRKLLEYGFWNRAGALIHSPFYTGRIEHPERFNYVNHPFPIYWVYTVFYLLMGAWGSTVLAGALNLVGCWLTFLLFRRLYGFWPAILSAVGYALAAPVIIYCFQHNSGPWLWPILAWVATHRTNGISMSKAAARLLGLCVFLAGQIDWLTYLYVPALLAITLERRPTARETLAASLKSAAWRWIIGGWLATVAVFLVQIAWYMPGEARTSHLGYLVGRTGALAGAASVAKYVRMFFFKTLVMGIGPALILGAGCGLWAATRMRQWPGLVVGALVFFAAFAASALALWQYYFAETHMFTYLVWPASCLAAFGLAHCPGRWIRIAFAALIIPGMALGMMHASNLVRVSTASQALAPVISKHTRIDDLVFWPGAPRAFPFAAWDHQSIVSVAMLADRIVIPAATNREAVAQWLRLVAPTRPRAIFVRVNQIPVAEDLQEWLQQHGRLVAEEVVTIPPEAENIAQRLRLFYWKITGRYAVGSVRQAPTSRELTMQFYELGF